MTATAAALLAHFHRGLRAARGRVEAVVGARALAAPYFRALAAAGLGGAVLMGALCPAGAGAATLALRLDAARGAPGPVTVVDLAVVSSAGARPSAMERLVVCAMAEKSADLGGPVSVKAGRVAGLDASEASRLALAMDDDAFGRIAAAHEAAHCGDEELVLPSAMAGMPAAEAEYAHYRQESFADAYAALREYATGPGAATALEWADLRAVSVLANGVRGDAGGWARYYTAPAVDAVLRWAEQVGPAHAAALTEAQAAQVARRLADASLLPRPAFAEFAGALPRTEIAEGRAVFQPGVPAGFGGRVEAALARLGPGLGAAAVLERRALRAPR